MISLHELLSFRLEKLQIQWSLGKPPHTIIQRLQQLADREQECLLSPSSKASSYGIKARMAPTQLGSAVWGIGRCSVTCLNSVVSVLASGNASSWLLRERLFGMVLGWVSRVRGVESRMWMLILWALRGWAIPFWRNLRWCCWRLSLCTREGDTGTGHEKAGRYCIHCFHRACAIDRRMMKDNCKGFRGASKLHWVSLHIDAIGVKSYFGMTCILIVPCSIIHMVPSRILVVSHYLPTW